MCTPYFYAGHPNAIVAADPIPRGVELSITYFGIEGEPQAMCVMSCDQFAEFVASGEAILAATRAARDNHDTA